MSRPKIDIVQQRFPAATIEDRLRQFDRLCHQKAFQAWKRLPVASKLWVDPEDLYQEACLEVHKCFTQWDVDKASLSTFVYIVVENRMKDLVLFLSREKRCAQYPVGLEIVDLQPVCWDITPVSKQSIDPIVEFALGRT